MAGISGSIKLRIHRANGQTEEYQTGNAVVAALATTIHSRMSNNATVFSAGYVPSQIVVTLSGSGGSASGDADGDSRLLADGLGTNAYTNSVVYKKNGLTFGSASGETVATVQLKSAGGTVVASQTSFTAIGGGTWANPGFSPSDKLDVEYTLTFIHTNMGAVDGTDYNATLNTYRDNIINNVVYGGTDYDIAITQATIGIDDAVLSVMPSFSLSASGTATLSWLSVTGAIPDRIKVYTADPDKSLAGVFWIDPDLAESDFDIAWTSGDNVTAPFAYTVSAS